jgi:carbamate kinase
MRVVVALGGNALLKRGEPMTSEVQRANIRVAAQALAPLVKDNQLVITHGNGPQVGLLALQGAAYKPDEAYPLDVLGAETEGMIGYMIEQELGNLLPYEVPFATLLTMVEVDPDDPGFKNPTKFVGPVYDKPEADRIAKDKGWTFKPDGAKWRRVVPSPLPQHIFEIRPVRWLLDHGAIVICAGGGGIPTMYEKGANRKLVGVEAVIDKDLCSELLARELDADLFVMLTDADAVYVDWGKPTQKAIRSSSPLALAGIEFAAGSMGPKVQAACRFAAATGNRAAIGALADLSRIIAGEAGTTIAPKGATQYA